MDLALVAGRIVVAVVVVRKAIAAARAVMVTVRNVPVIVTAVVRAATIVVPNYAANQSRRCRKLS